jgi:hypothetical protein
MPYWRFAAIVVLVVMVLFLVASYAFAGKLVEPTTKADGSALTGLRDCEYVEIATPTSAPDWAASTRLPASSPAGGGTSQWPTDGETVAARCTRVNAGGTAVVSATTVFTFRAEPSAAPDVSD